MMCAKMLINKIYPYLSISNSTMKRHYMKRENLVVYHHCRVSCLSTVIILYHITIMWIIIHYSVVSSSGVRPRDGVLYTMAARDNRGPDDDKAPSDAAHTLLYGLTLVIRSQYRYIHAV